MEKRRIASLLNSCASSNILDTNRVQINEVIADYFTQDSEHDLGWSNGESESESDSSDNEAEGDDADVADVTDVGHNEGSCGDEKEDETPIVQVHGGADCVPDDMARNLQEDAALLAMARQKSCFCKRIPVPQNARADDRRGCLLQFSPDEIVAFQLSVQDMDRASVDMLVLGVLNAGMRNGEQTASSKKKAQKERQKSRTEYQLLGRTVCRKAFLFLLNGMNRKRLTRLSKHYKQHGSIQPTLNSGGRKNNTASLSLQDTQRVLDFILNFAEDHGVSLPGRVPGFRRDDIRLLPSAFPKSAVYRRYKESASEAGHRVVGASTFRKLWLQLCPYVVVARPMTDLCWRCQQNNAQIFRSANLPEEEKTELLQRQQTHLSRVDAERQFYKQLVNDSKAEVQRQNITSLRPNPPNSRQCAMHYSFDFAQQIHYPARPDQPGPIYFLTPRKCAVFGICCEGLPQQVNYLVDEAVNCSKGSNAVISYIHHFLHNYGCGETTMHLHCDNCTGQNKNKYMMWYLCWRVQNSLHNEITINFMPAGHTKFAPDWCFGLFKRKFRRCDISCLEDICTAVRDSTPTSGVNQPQLVGDEAGNELVPTYHWQSFFLNGAYNALPKITSISHMRFTSAEPGKVFYRCSLAEEEQQFTMVNGARYTQHLPNMPDRLRPSGLSFQRQLYLHNSIREFVRQDADGGDTLRDRVCPRPVQAMQQ